jgi:putative DNA primase/helicase
MKPAHKPPVREVAQGKWAGILGRYLDDRTLSGKHGPCPICGGKDRFRFDDKDGHGTWFCSHCGAGDGFHLLMHANGWTFAEAASHVESFAPKVQKVKPLERMSNEDARASMQRVWAAAKAVTEGDPVHMYLSARCGIKEVPPTIRFHPAMTYTHENGVTSTHPGMVARVIRADGAATIGLHRTYLTAKGEKADLPIVRKLMTPSEAMDGAAVRLAPVLDGWLGVAEGIETALCASALHGVSVWSCVTAGLLEKFDPPQGVTLLTVFADNDRSFTGQKSGYTLAHKLASKRPEIEVRFSMPDIVGQDYADVFAERRAA